MFWSFLFYLLKMTGNRRFRRLTAAENCKKLQISRKTYLFCRQSLTGPDPDGINQERRQGTGHSCPVMFCTVRDRTQLSCDVLHVQERTQLSCDVLHGQDPDTAVL